MGHRCSIESLWPKHAPYPKFNDPVASVICPPPDQLLFWRPPSLCSSWGSIGVLCCESLLLCASTKSISTTSKCKVHIFSLPSVAILWEDNCCQKCSGIVHSQVLSVIFPPYPEQWAPRRGNHQVRQSWSASSAPSCRVLVIHGVLLPALKLQRVWSLCTNILSREFDTRYEKFSGAVWFFECT